MPQRRAAYPSALKTGAAHLALSTGLIGGLTITVGGGLALLGNPDDAGPRVTVALFEPVDEAGVPALKSRLADPAVPDLQIAALVPIAERPDVEEPSLGIEYRAPRPAPRQLAAARPSVRSVEEGSSSEPVGVRINGRTVLPGEAFSAVRGQRAGVTSLVDDGSSGSVPVAAKATGPAGTMPAEAHARPFDAPDGVPTVSIVLGGLGLNYTHTRTAIAELPPEVTLSFSPHAKGLDTWIRRAREAGHEVLIEVPMEAGEYGRIKPHPLTLEAGASVADTRARLDRILGATSDYFGVINYQGDKFARNTVLTGAVVDHLEAKGLAFIEDGNLVDSNFSAAATASDARYAKANEVIDVRIEADAMRDRLMALELAAKDTGAALGTAIAYPVTIDALRDWAKGLESRGLVLAPASHHVRSGAQARPAPANPTPSQFGPEAEAVAWQVIEPRPFSPTTQ